MPTLSRARSINPDFSSTSRTVAPAGTATTMLSSRAGSA